MTASIASMTRVGVVPAPSGNEMAAATAIPESQPVDGRGDVDGIDADGVIAPRVGLRGRDDERP